MHNFSYVFSNIATAMHSTLSHFSLLLILLVFTSIGSAHTLDTFSDLRKDYETAMHSLRVGDINRFNEQADKLKDYPLHPYLEYETINLKNKKSEKRISAFLDKYQDAPVAQKMRIKYLNRLVKTHQWDKFLSYWIPDIRDARLNCWHLRAMYRTGEKKAALDSVQPLWLKARSQPKACDPLFKEWIEAGYLTQETAWARMELAMDARKTRLARYIVRKLLKDDYASLGQSYLLAHRKPHKLITPKHSEAFTAHPEKARKILLHAVKRLSRKDADKAEKLWQQSEQRLSFTEEQAETAKRSLAIGQAINHTGSIDATQLDMFADVPANALEQRIRQALRETDWPSIFYLIQLLPEDKQNSDRWKYWQARSIDQQGLTQSGLPAPKEIYSSLAQKRSYYGFLSADLLKEAYAMQDRPALVEESSFKVISENQAMIRALELYALGRIDDARREWRYAARSIKSSHLLAAGKLAENFNWYEKAIRSYIKAKYWNDLKTRFPLAYQTKIVAASENTQLDSSWIYAIARQESAFSHDAKSHAGAMGLMQLLPSTAKQTARQIGLSFKRADLLKPETNINIGSNYLKTLLKQFNGNRILATTAYNAGPHRVKKWLKESESNLPFDVWIETIPFKETRHYVQNVLAFSVIYDYRMDKKGRLVTHDESKQLL